MKLLSAVCSDRGIKKKINQDSLLVRSAMTKEGEILLAAVCDGMGGLEKGEVASGEVIRALARWFEETLPLLLFGEQEKKGVGERRKREIAKSLESLIQEENQMISVYGKEKNLLLGTTVSAVLLIAVFDRTCWRFSCLWAYRRRAAADKRPDLCAERN